MYYKHCDQTSGPYYNGYIISWAMARCCKQDQSYQTPDRQWEK